jgi:uncharacterized phage infection (PIP) family protein YhgE
MPYTLTSIATVAECDEILAHLTDVNATLENRRQNLAFRTNQVNSNAEEYQQELNALNAELGTEQTLFNTLPDGPRREEARLNILEIDLKLGRLRKSEDTYGGFATVMRALSLTNTQNQTNETNQLIAEVTARRATLV